MQGVPTLYGREGRCEPLSSGADGSQGGGPMWLHESLRAPDFSIAGCETGQSKITDAYRLPCKKVIHTVGPVWYGGSKGEGRLLASCYDTALELANANRLHRIAFPCISTSVYRFPKAEAARIASHSIFCIYSGEHRKHKDWLCLRNHDSLLLWRGRAVLPRLFLGRITDIVWKTRRYILA